MNYEVILFDLVGTLRPVVIFMHYVLAVTTPGRSYWNDPPKEAFYKAIDAYNVIAVFHGHDHASGRRQWRGLDVYNVGSPQTHLSQHRNFAVVRVTDRQITVAYWNWQQKRWNWTHRKPINAAAGRKHTTGSQYLPTWLAPAGQAGPVASSQPSERPSAQLRIEDSRWAWPGYREALEYK